MRPLLKSASGLIEVPSPALGQESRIHFQIRVHFQLSERGRFVARARELPIVRLPCQTQNSLLVGLTSMANTEAAGTSSCNNSRRFMGQGASVQVFTPVTFPLGSFRLETSPIATGSSPVVKTIGTVAVAVLAARAATLPKAAITATCWRTRSAASAGQSIILPLRPTEFDPEILALA